MRTNYGNGNTPQQSISLERSPTSPFSKETEPAYEIMVFIT